MNNGKFIFVLLYYRNNNLNNVRRTVFYKNQKCSLYYMQVLDKITFTDVEEE